MKIRRIKFEDPSEQTYAEQIHIRWTLFPVLVGQKWGALG